MINGENHSGEDASLMNLTPNDEEQAERIQIIRSRAEEFFLNPDNADVRLKPEEFLALFDPWRDGHSFDSKGDIKTE